MLARRHSRSLIPDDEVVDADLDDIIAAVGFASLGLDVTPPPAVIALSSWLQVIERLAVVLMCPIRVQGDPSRLYKPSVDSDLGCSVILHGQ